MHEIRDDDITLLHLLQLTSYVLLLYTSYLCRNLHMSLRPFFEHFLIGMATLPIEAVKYWPEYDLMDQVANHHLILSVQPGGRSSHYIPY